MNHNVGASFGLSVLVVVFFAVALYQPDKAPPTLAAGAGSAPAEAQPPGKVDDPSPPTSPTPPALTNPSPGSTTPVVTARPRVRSGGADVTGGPLATTAERSKARRVEPVRAVVARPVSRRTVRPVEPRGAFTEARKGESLADVAHRVYGSADSTDALWFANRDILDRGDGPLPAGTLLRTP